jgi:hypothetical protein
MCRKDLSDWQFWQSASGGDKCLYVASSTLLVTGMEEVSELFAGAMEGRNVMKLFWPEGHANPYRVRQATQNNSHQLQLIFPELYSRQVGQTSTSRGFLIYALRCGTQMLVYTSRLLSSPSPSVSILPT